MVRAKRIVFRLHGDHDLDGTPTKFRWRVFLDLSSRKVRTVSTNIIDAVLKVLRLTILDLFLSRKRGLSRESNHKPLPQYRLSYCATRIQI